MTNIEVTMEQRMCLEFQATDEEIETLKKGYLPDRIEEEFSKRNWTADAWHDYAVYDCDNQKDLVEWD